MALGDLAPDLVGRFGAEQVERDRVHRRDRRGLEQPRDRLVRRARALERQGQLLEPAEQDPLRALRACPPRHARRFGRPLGLSCPSRAERSGRASGRPDASVVAVEALPALAARASPRPASRAGARARPSAPRRACSWSAPEACTWTSIPIRSISAQGPSASRRRSSSPCRGPRGHARLVEHAHAVVQERDQDPVDDEAGRVVAADGLLAARSAQAYAASTAASSLRSVRTISTSGSTGAGLKKCMPITRSGRSVASAISVDGERGRVRREDRVGRAHALELGEQLPLGVDVLDDRLDHEVAVGEVGDLGRRAEPASAASRSTSSSRPFSTARPMKCSIRPRARSFSSSLTSRPTTSFPARTRSARCPRPSSRARRRRRSRSREPRRAILCAGFDQPRLGTALAQADVRVAPEALREEPASSQPVRRAGRRRRRADGARTPPPAFAREFLRVADDLDDRETACQTAA